MYYITLVQYVQRYFATRIKVAQKSHIWKLEEAVSAFEKNFSEKCRQIIEQSVFTIQEYFLLQWNCTPKVGFGKAQFGVN